MPSFTKGSVGKGVRGLSTPCLFSAAFLLVISVASSPSALAQTTTAPQQTNGTIIPGPPVFAGIVPTWTGASMSPYGQVEGSKPSIGPHQAQQDPTDPTHAHDSVTGQNLYWDPDKKTWVDSATGQEIGFDGVQTVMEP